MKELKQLIARFLEKCGLGKTDYMYIPVDSDNEIHVHLFEVINVKKLEEIIKSGSEFGFKIKAKKTDGAGTDIEELIFIINVGDWPQIKTAMHSVGLTTEEFTQTNE